MIKRYLAIGVVVLLWGLTFAQGFVVLNNSSISVDWQFASIVPLVLISTYCTGILWSWLGTKSAKTTWKR